MTQPGQGSVSHERNDIIHVCGLLEIDHGCGLELGSSRLNGKVTLLATQTFYSLQNEMYSMVQPYFIIIVYSV